MSDKYRNTKKLRNSPLFPKIDDYILSFEKDYEELIEIKKKEIRRNLSKLQNMGYSITILENIIQTKYNSAISSNSSLFL